MGTTTLRVKERDGGIECQFGSHRGGAQDWPTIVDAFSKCLADACYEAGVEDYITPRARLLGQRAVARVPLDVFLKAYRRFKSTPELKEACSQGDFEWVVDRVVLDAIRADGAARKKKRAEHRARPGKPKRRKMLAPEGGAQ